MCDIDEPGGSPELYGLGVPMLLSKLKDSVWFEVKLATHSVA